MRDKRNFLRLDLTTKMDRTQTLTVIPRLINGCGGWVIDHTLFSNISASIIFEMPLAATGDLLARMEAAGYRPNLRDEYPTGTEGDVRGSVAITFIHDEPDMKRDVPAFG